MAIRPINRSFAPVNKQINYLSKTFPQWRQNLIDFAKVYYRDSYTDFNEASPGMMFVEMAAYVGDVLSYYIDTNFRENLMIYAEEQDNIIAMAQAFGYKPKPASAALTTIDFYQLCPAGDASVNYEPDVRYLLRLAANTVVSAPEYGGISFRTMSETNFADPLDRDITVYAVDGGRPLTYLVRKSINVSSGVIQEFRATFGEAERFARTKLPDASVLEIISVKDSNGQDWYEVDYLAQDLIFEARDNLRTTSVDGFSVPPTYTMRIRRTPRRFVTRYDENFNLELQFGSGILDDSDGLVNLDPNKIGSSEYQTNLASTSLDPSDFLSSRSYGLAPANLEMTIRYVTGGGISSNVPSNSITKVSTVKVLTDRSSFGGAEQSLFDEVVQSLAVNNPEPAVGGKDADSVEEIRQNALAFFNAQNRAVTKRDYVVRAYAMPPKFGAAAKVFVTSDDQLNEILRTNQQQAPNGGSFVTNGGQQNIVNLYTLGYNQNKKLVRLNLDTKKNLRTYIDQYRILTDEVRILDAFVVNIGINFKVVVYKGYNSNDVLARCIDAVANFFDIEKWNINQPIILNDLYLEIAQVEGVQTVKNVEVVNKYQYRDGADYEDFIYDISAATMDGIVYPSLDPSIWEVRYPQHDIVGSAVQ